MATRLVYAAMSASAAAIFVMGVAVAAAASSMPPQDWTWAESCAINAPNIAGQTRLTVSNWQSVDKDGNHVSSISLAFGIPSADLPSTSDQKISNAKVRIKDGPIWDMEGTRTDRGDASTLTLKFKGDLSDLIRPLAKGSEMTLSLPTAMGGKSYTVPLVGSGKAVAAFKKCIS